jgi:hypothetical protein
MPGSACPTCLFGGIITNDFILARLDFGIL